MTELRTIDISVAPVDSATITDRADSISTTSGGGSTAAVASVGHRASVGSASGDDALIQTPERVVGGGSWCEASFTALLAGTQEGRIFEAGFIDDSDVGAYFRITGQSTIQLVVQKGAAIAEQVTTADASAVDLTRVRTYAVRIKNERSAEFCVDGTSLGSIDATTAKLFAVLGGLRAGFRLRNPSALVGSANVDCHEVTVSAEELPVPRRAVSSLANLIVFKAGGGRLHELSVLTGSSDERFVLVFDKATDPVDTDVPVLRFQIPAGARTFHMEPNARGFLFAKGVSVAVSTAPAALTLPGAAEAFFEGSYT